MTWATSSTRPSRSKGRDAPNHGENADGFAAKSGLGEGNTFVGCRSWGNSDDGFDLWEAGAGVTLVNCWAFRNGVNVWRDTAFNGDGTIDAIDLACLASHWLTVDASGVVNFLDFGRLAALWRQ